MESELCYFVEHLIQDEPNNTIVVTNQPPAQSLPSIDDTAPMSKSTTTESSTAQMMLVTQQPTEQVGNDLVSHVEAQNPTDSSFMEDEFQSPVQEEPMVQLSANDIRSCHELGYSIFLGVDKVNSLLIAQFLNDENVLCMIVIMLNFLLDQCW
jgi:hypothetical protein